MSCNKWDAVSATLTLGCKSSPQGRTGYAHVQRGHHRPTRFGGAAFACRRPGDTAEGLARRDGWGAASAGVGAGPRRQPVARAAGLSSGRAGRSCGRRGARVASELGRDAPVGAACDAGAGPGRGSLHGGTGGATGAAGRSAGPETCRNRRRCADAGGTPKRSDSCPDGGGRPDKRRPKGLVRTGAGAAGRRGKARPDPARRPPRAGAGPDQPACPGTGGPAVAGPGPAANRADLAGAAGPLSPQPHGGLAAGRGDAGGRAAGRRAGAGAGPGGRHRVQHPDVATDHRAFVKGRADRPRPRRLQPQSGPPESPPAVKLCRRRGRDPGAGPSRRAGKPAAADRLAVVATGGCGSRPLQPSRVGA